jgi:hypothetical protein
MDPISQVDQLAMILRQRILEHSKTRADKRKPTGTEPKTSWVVSLKALAAKEAISDHQLRRALVQNILADQFGHDMLNEMKFQQVVERVTEALEGDKGGTALLNRCVAELRAGQ